MWSQWQWFVFLLIATECDASEVKLGFSFILAVQDLSPKFWFPFYSKKRYHLSDYIQRLRNCP